MNEYRTVVEQGMWAIRTYQELCALYKDLDIVADVKKRGLEWVGHVVRMDQGRTLNKIFESILEGREELQDLERDGWKVLGRIYKRWLKDDDRRQCTEMNGPCN
jgi:hypothetical protein